MFAKNVICPIFSILLAGISLLVFASPVSATTPGAGPSSIANCPASISFGQTIACTIATSGGTNSYTFTASASDKVLARVTKTSGSFSPYIVINGPSMPGMCTIDYWDPAAVCNLSADGTYTIQVSDEGGTGTGGYDLYLQRMNNPGGPIAISFGQTLAGTITYAAQMDTYAFSASDGDSLLVRMTASNSSLSAEFRVYGPDGSAQCPSTYESTNTVWNASCKLTGSGTFSILAGDSQYAGTGTGSYSLYLQRVNNPGNPAAIAFGQTLSGLINTPARIDTYTFSASARDNLLVRAVVSTGTLSAQIYIFDSSGFQTCKTSYGSSTAEIASCSINNDGTYSILVFDSDGSANGSYHLYLQRLNNPGNAVASGFGQMQTGSITTPAQMNAYTFSASANDVVLARLTKFTGTMTPEITIYDPTGAQVCDQEGSTVVEIPSCFLNTSGTYSILAADYQYGGTGTGDYHLFVQRLNNPGNATPIGMGQTLTGSINMSGQMNAYTFSASAGNIVSLTMTKTSGNIWPGITIYDPSGAKLCENYGYNSAQISGCNLSSTGTYTILNYDYWDGTLTGSYSLNLQWLNAPLVTVALKSVASQDGWVLESSENSNKGGTLNSIASLYLGDNAARRQYRSILSFSTGPGLPDNAVITAVTLKLKRQNMLGGGNPVTAFLGLMVDIKNGTFGTAALQVSDFQAAASQSLGPFKPALASSGWYTIPLTGAIANINNSTAGSGLTQIRLRFKLDDNGNAVANILSLFSGNAAAANRPQLVITYYVP